MCVCCGVRYSRRAAELALDVAREALEEALGRRIEYGEGEDLAMQVQRDVAAQLLGKIAKNLIEWRELVVSFPVSGRKLAARSCVCLFVGSIR